MQDAAVHEILDFIGGIDPAQCLEGEARPILAGDMHIDVLTRLEIGNAGDGEAVIARQAQRRAGIAADELKRENAHADQVLSLIQI